jgi:hypothetical protein
MMPGGERRPLNPPGDASDKALTSPLTPVSAPAFTASPPIPLTSHETGEKRTNLFGDRNFIPIDLSYCGKSMAYAIAPRGIKYWR